MKSSMNMSETVSRRDFLKKGLQFSAGLLLAPAIIPFSEALAAVPRQDDEGLGIRDYGLSFGPLERRTRTDAIVIHHAGFPSDLDTSAREIHNLHLSRGWSGVGYHYIIRKDGTIERGRPRDAVGAHCYHDNEHTVGINLAGNFDIARPTPAQVIAGQRLLAELCRIYGINPERWTILGHRDLIKTSCPGGMLHSLLPVMTEGAKRLRGEAEVKEESESAGNAVSLVRKRPGENGRNGATQKPRGTAQGRGKSSHL